MSNLQPNCCLEFDFRKVDQHAGGKYLESLIDIDAKVRQLRCKNEQVEPIPPTGI